MDKKQWHDYDLGYSDGFNNRESKQPFNSEYMTGFYEGQIDADEGRINADEIENYQWQNENHD